MTSMPYKFLKRNKGKLYLLSLCLLLFSWIDIFAIGGQSDVRYYSTIILYITLVGILRVNSLITFLNILLLIPIMSFKYFIDGPDMFTEEVAIWFVLFFIVGIFQKWREI